MKDGAKPRDLEDRTFLFAESVRALAKQLPKTIGNIEDLRQASASFWIGRRKLDRSRRSIKQKRFHFAGEDLSKGSEGKSALPKVG